MACFRPLVSEYGHHIPALHSLQVIFPEDRLPKGARLVHQGIAKRVDDKALVHESLQQIRNGDQFLVSQFGVPRDPIDFLGRAAECGHPRGIAIHLPDNVKKVLEDNLFMDAAELSLLRCRELLKWTNRAAALASEERKFKDGMPQHLSRLMQKKRLLLFQEMLESVSYPDRNLVRDIAKDFRLTGWQEQTKIFPSCVKRPQFDLETLRKWLRVLTNPSLVS